MILVVVKTSNYMVFFGECETDMKIKQFHVTLRRYKEEYKLFTINSIWIDFDLTINLTMAEIFSKTEIEAKAFSIFRKVIRDLGSEGTIIADKKQTELIQIERVMYKIMRGYE